MFKLEELKRLAGERTKGEWLFHYSVEEFDYPTVVNSLGDEICASTHVGDAGETNAKFIAYVGTHADAIVQMLEKLDYDVWQHKQWLDNVNVEYAQSRREYAELLLNYRKLQELWSQREKEMTEEMIKFKEENKH